MTTTDTTPADETTTAPEAPARECEYCGEPLPPASGRGRPKRFCDRTCRRAARRERLAAEAEAAAEAPAAEEKPKAAKKAAAKKAEPEAQADDQADLADDEDVI